jgi:hypothetical protein
MLETPYPGREVLEFDSEFIRVLCLASQETVRGLQWALDRNAVSDRKFKLFLGTLGNLAEHIDTDIVLVAIDLGQPVPIENLKKLKSKPGLGLFIQPTPQQLLQLNELAQWQSMAWDSVSFEKLAIRLDEVAMRYRKEIQSNRFIEACRSFIKRSDENVDLVEWLNPPDNYTGLTIFCLDANRGLLTVGGSESSCDLRLPLDGNNRGEVGEFRYINHRWTFKPAYESAPIQVKGMKGALAPLDQIEVQRNILSLKKPVKVEEFIRLARRMGIIEEKYLLEKVKAEPGISTIVDVCRDLILSGVSGELRLSSKLKTGSIFFHDGIIIHAVTGSVNGLKALLRMFSWQEAQWRFNLRKQPHSDRTHVRIALNEFSKIYEAWIKAWSKVASFIPPHQMKLKVNAQKYLEKSSFTTKEVKVMAAIAEYTLVRDILNMCTGMVDVEIIQTLVHLRKQGIIEPNT